MKLYITILVLIGLFLGGCAYNAPVRPTVIENRDTVNVSFDVAWQKSISVLVSKGLLISSSDKPAGIITTQKGLMKLDESQVDCGNVWGISYLKDPRTQISIACSIYLKSETLEKTSIIVNTQVEGIFNATANSETKQLSCYSLGKIEKEIIAGIKY